jgi:hypothetical protein
MTARGADTRDMATAAAPAIGDTTWHVLSDGAPLANVASYRDGGGVVVTAHFFANAGEAERIRPYRFDDSESADAFVRDLVASFSYLGCHVSRQ